MYESPSDRTPDLAAGLRHFAPAPAHHTVELHDEHDPIVYVPDPYDPRQSVAVRRSQLQAPANGSSRDLRPQPLFDPQAQRWLGAGIGGGAFAAGLGWGIGQAVGAFAGLGTGALFWIAVLVLAAKFGGSGGSYREGDQYFVTNNTRGFGRSHTSI